MKAMHTGVMVLKVVAPMERDVLHRGVAENRWVPNERGLRV